MATRTLDQVLASLGGTYDPQVEQIRKRQSSIPGQIASEEEGLAAKQTAAYDQILSGARGRGLGFSGIPLAEQAKYNSTEYMPALARLKQSGREQAMSLEDAILGINERRRTAAQGIYDNELNRGLQERQFAEQQRQFNENLNLQRAQMATQQRAASGGGGAAGLGALFGGGRKEAPQPSAQQRGDKGFNFTDAGGKSISAARYAALTGKDIRDVLHQMGQSGDQYAAQLYNQLSNPYTWNDFLKNTDRYKKQYSAIFWGA